MTTAADVRWAYKYYLGREPENPEVLDYFLRTSLNDDRNLTTGLFDSEEAQAGDGKPSPHGEFCVWRPGRPKLMVIGNCIGPNLGRTLAALTDVSVYAIDVLNFLDKQAEVLTYLDDADFLLAPHFGPDFGLLSGARMRDRLGQRLAFYELTFFSGVHPDLTYLGGRTARLLSPLGDYHSKLVLQSFLAGRDPAGCQRAFQEAMADAAAHQQIYRDSTSEYLRREALSDIRISDWLFDAIRRRPLLYTVNHPTTEVLAETARAACAWFGLNCANPAPPIIANDMSRNVIWPVHAAVAAHNGLHYSTPDVFWMDRYMMDLDELIWRSYRLYGRYDAEDLRAAARERGLAPS